MISSNKPKDQTQNLYLKEFFGHFFERKQMLETLSSLHNGLKVLEVLIDNFQHTHRLPPTRKTQKHFTSNPGSQTDIEKQSQYIHQLLEGTYNRLEHIFDCWNNNTDKEELFKEQKLSSSRSLFSKDDDEQLYDMLNKYKQDFKKEREVRLRLEKEIKELHFKIEELESENRELKQQKKVQLFSIQQAHKQQEKLQEQIKEMNCQLENQEKQAIELGDKILQYEEIAEDYSKLKADSEILSLKLVQSESRQKLLQQKFKAIEGIVKAKIEEKSSQWQEMVNNKISQSDIYKAPACRVLKSLIDSLSKQNRVANS